MSTDEHNETKNLTKSIDELKKEISDARHEIKALSVQIGKLASAIASGQTSID